MQQVLEKLTDLPPSTGAEEIDIIFLKGIMENPIVRSLAKVFLWFGMLSRYQTYAVMLRGTFTGECSVAIMFCCNHTFNDLVVWSQQNGSE